jgi:hypothetical protein
MSVGKWIRLRDPATPEGEVRLEAMHYTSGDLARVLDVAEVPLERPAGDCNHPEDWMLALNRPWRRFGWLPFGELSALADRLLELWHDGTHERWVPAGFIPRMSEPSSLALLENPPECRVTWWRELAPDPDHPGALLEKTRRRLSLRFAGRLHEFDITDPEFTRRHRLFDTAELNRPQTLDLKPPLFLCLSLTRPWQGKHYKICAAVFQS